jgi:hypothetical protein
MASLNEDEEYEIPLEDQRVFGAGLKRKRVQFVPASTSDSQSTSAATPKSSVGDFYLSLVLPSSTPQLVSPSDSSDNSSDRPQDPETESPQICQICNLPITLNEKHPHTTLLAHQISLPHSQPPSSFPNDRPGVRMLRAQGWDPDSRVGLGKDGEGMRYPIKVHVKDDKLGLGVVLPKELEKREKEHERLRDTEELRREVATRKAEGVKGKGKKAVVRKVEEERRNEERLRQAFYGSEEVERYLGGGDVQRL